MVVFVPKNVHQHVAVNPFPCALFLALSLSLGPLPPPSAFLELLITSLTPGIGGCCFFLFQLFLNWNLLKEEEKKNIYI